MSKRTDPLALSPSHGLLPTTEAAPLEVIEPRSPFAGFFSFSYTCTEISSAGGKTQVRARQTRLADGKLTTERFEGELDASAYERMAAEAQQRLVEQTRWLLQPFSWFLPPGRK